MDFNGRASQPQPTGSNPQMSGPTVASGGSKKNNKKPTAAWKLWGGGVIGLLVVGLVVAVLLVIGFGGPKPESSFVKDNELQAVFLNTGQVYFGHLTVSNKYFVLKNIYYLQTSGSSSTTTTTSTSTAGTSVSLVKLGCELHAPEDQMVINNSEVTFWENLQNSGQVATAVATFQKDNPNGQKCSSQSSTGSATSVQGSNSSNTTTTNSTTGTSTTPKQ